MKSFKEFKEFIDNNAFPFTEEEKVFLNNTIPNSFGEISFKQVEASIYEKLIFARSGFATIDNTLRLENTEEGLRDTLEKKIKAYQTLTGYEFKSSGRNSRDLVKIKILFLEALNQASNEMGMSDFEYGIKETNNRSVEYDFLLEEGKSLVENPILLLRGGTVKEGSKTDFDIWLITNYVPSTIKYLEYIENLKRLQLIKSTVIRKDFNLIPKKYFDAYIISQAEDEMDCSRSILLNQELTYPKTTTAHRSKLSLVSIGEDFLNARLAANRKWVEKWFNKNAKNKIMSRIKSVKFITDHLNTYFNAQLETPQVSIPAPYTPENILNELINTNYKTYQMLYNFIRR